MNGERPDYIRKDSEKFQAFNKQWWANNRGRFNHRYRYSGYNNHRFHHNFSVKLDSRFTWPILAITSRSKINGLYLVDEKFFHMVQINDLRFHYIRIVLKIFHNGIK